MALHHLYLMCDELAVDEPQDLNCEIPPTVAAAVLDIGKGWELMPASGDDYDSQVWTDDVPKQLSVDTPVVQTERFVYAWGYNGMNTYYWKFRRPAQMSCGEFLSTLTPAEQERLMPTGDDDGTDEPYIRVGESVFDACVRYIAECQLGVELVRKP